MSAIVFPSPQRLSPYTQAAPYKAASLNDADALSAPATATGTSGVVRPKFEAAGPLFKTTLGNGTQGYVMQKPGAQRSSICLTIPTSALPLGVDDLLTMTLMQGSLATRRQLEEWRQQGFHVNASKDEKRFSIWADAPAGQEIAMANVVTGLLKNPLVDPAIFNTLKTNLIHMQQAQMADPDSLLDNAMTRRLFGPNHPHSRSPQARISDLSTQTLPGVMAYHPSLLQLLGQGNVMMISPLPPENQRQSLITAFENFNAPKINGANPVDTATLGAHRNLLLPNESVQRALIKVTWQVPDARDPDYAAYSLLRHLLSGTSQHSFFKALRTDHSLVYAIQYDTSAYSLPQGRTYTPSIKVEFPKIGQALADMRDVTQSLCQAPISAEQLRSAQREQLLELRRAGETSGSTSDLYRAWLNCPGAQPPDFQEMQAAINRVTPADIQRVANRIFNDPKALRLMGVSAPTAVLQQWFPGQPLAKNEV